MRLDKFLKLSRIITRRTVAKEIAGKGRIKVNGQPAKASSNLQVGDEMTIHFAQKKLTIKIEDLREQVNKEQAENLYSVVNEERIQADE